MRITVTQPDSSLRLSRIFSPNHAITIAALTLIWVILAFTVILTRPFLPIIETRYVSIAWEMWIHHHYLVPLQNGLPYADKPPLLFWLMISGWHVFGVQAWWPRILPALFGYADAWMLYAIARQLWPGRQDIHLSCFIMLLGSMAWIVYSNLIMFDIVLSFWILLAVYGILKAYFSLCKRYIGWFYFTLGIGLGLLTKGPIIFIFVMVPALLLPMMITREHDEREPSSASVYRHIFIFTVIGAFIALLWAIPAAINGGADYAHAIFLAQTLGRIAPHQYQIRHSHAFPVWWYLQLLPFYLAPWFLFTPFYKEFFHIKRIMVDLRLRFLTASILITFIILSLLGSKQIQYPLPLIPFFILFLAYLINNGIKVNRRSLWLYNFMVLLLGITLLVMPMIIDHISRFQLAVLIPYLAAYVLIGYAVLLFFFNCNSSHSAQLFLSCSTLILIILLHGLIIHNGYHFYNIKPLAQFMHAVQTADNKIAYFGDYQDQFQFLGRLFYPLDHVTYDNLNAWVAAHQNGWILLNQHEVDIMHLSPIHHFYYQGRVVSMVPAHEFLH